MQSRTNNTGYFVAVDGPNGSGKTTVINAIAEKLGLMGYKVKVTREPTNSILGEFVRKYAEGIRSGSGSDGLHYGRFR